MTGGKDSEDRVQDTARREGVAPPFIGGVFAGAGSKSSGVLPEVVLFMVLPLAILGLVSLFGKSVFVGVIAVVGLFIAFSLMCMQRTLDAGREVDWGVIVHVAFMAASGLIALIWLILREIRG